MLPRVCSAGVIGAGLACSAACVPVVPAGMAEERQRPHAADPSLVELARLDPSREERALIVVFPRHACSGSARMVFTETNGAFVGAVAPGDAAIFAVPSAARALVAISSVEITAPLGLTTIRELVPIPSPPAGLLLHTRCEWRGNGQYAESMPATKGALEAAIGEADLRWLAPRRAEGQAWLDEHHARVDEVLRRGSSVASVLLDDHSAEDPGLGVDSR